jgi:hypothetical protein
MVDMNQRDLTPVGSFVLYNIRNHLKSRIVVTKTYYFITAPPLVWGIFAYN